MDDRFEVQKLLMRHGYNNFLDKQAKIAVQHILQILPNVNLRKRMALDLRLNKEELEANVTRFVRECANDAEAIGRQDVARRRMIRAPKTAKSLKNTRKGSPLRSKKEAGWCEETVRLEGTF